MTHQETIDRAGLDIVHAHECVDPQPGLRTGSGGDQMMRCQTCGRFSLLTEVDTPPSAPAGVTTHVCRPHHHPVTWRGKGCPECAAELTKENTNE